VNIVRDIDAASRQACHNFIAQRPGCEKITIKRDRGIGVRQRLD
jgi:hypothetical protein